MRLLVGLEHFALALQLLQQHLVPLPFYTELETELLLGFGINRRKHSGNN